MDYVTNHNMITMAMTIFKTLKMAAERGVLWWKPIRFNLAFIWTFLCLTIGKVVIYGQ